MLKNNAIKRIATSSLALIIMFLFCMFPKTNNIQVPEEVIYTNDLTMPIYAIDHNNYVARTSIAKNDDQIAYIIDVLTIGSINNNYLPVGFAGIIPKGTKLLDYSIDNKLLKLNFSKEFLNVNEKNEEKVIEALIYSLCELKEIDKIMIFVENEQLQKLPISKKSLPITLDKNYGINKTYAIDSIKNSSKATIYYTSKYKDNLYYIPITKITNDTIEAVEIIVKELQSTPIYSENLISYLNASYELQDYEILENSVTLSFNNELIANLSEKAISEKIKYTLALSIRDTYNVDNIVININ